jgi:Flp pilus assembly protein TadD
MMMVVMSTKTVSKKMDALIGLVLLAGAGCFAQSPETTQQQASDHLQKAQAYLQAKKPELAIPELETVVKLDPDNAEAQGNLGVLLFFRGDYADAVPALRAALKIQPGLTKMQMLLGVSEKRLGDLSLAQTDLEQVFPQLTDVHMRTDAGLELVDLYTVTGNMEKAAATIADLEKIDPASPQLLYVAYRLYSDLAGQSMLSLSLVAPDSAQMHAVMGHEQARQGNDAAAIAQYNQALSIDPKLPGADFELAELLRRAGDMTERANAAKTFQAALKVNPFDERACSELGDIALEKGNFNEARADYTQALKLQPSDPGANFGMAKTLLALNDTEHGIPMLEKAVQLDPSNASAHYRLGMLYRKEGRTEDARQQLEDYQKLYKLKQKLDTLYRQMRLQPLAQSDDKQTK